MATRQRCGRDPASPAVRSTTPVRSPASADLISTPPQKISASSGVGHRGVPADELGAEDAIRAYKGLSRVQRAMSLPHCELHASGRRTSS